MCSADRLSVIAIDYRLIDVGWSLVNGLTVIVVDDWLGVAGVAGAAVY
jgi:hypothetical protein